jgi:1-acyl-sn-glycerol-3-phosphate acyltransferase
MAADVTDPPAPPPAPEAPHEAGPPTRSHVSRWLVVLLWPIHRLFMRLYFRVEVVGRGRIPAKGPVILAPTHRSRWDTLALACATNRTLRFMASHDEFVGVQGWFMRHLGAFAINTRRPTPGAMRHCRELIEAGQLLVIFPEGTLYYYPPDQVHPLKPGTAWLALDCQERCPSSPLTIVPVRLNYGDRILRFRSRIRVVVQEPIRLDAYLGLPRKEAIRTLTADLQRGMGDVVNESLAEMSVPRAATSEPREG